MPNIASSVSDLYKNDPRREGGFSIFYTAINIGAFFPPLVAAFIIQTYGWYAAFFMAAIGVLIGLLTMLLRKINHKQASYKKIGITILIIITMIVALVFLMNHVMLANIALFAVSFVLLVLLS